MVEGSMNERPTTLHRWFRRHFMKRMGYFITGAVMAAMLATGANTYAQSPGFGHRGGGPGRPGLGGPGLALPLRQLNLTDAQQQQVQSIRERHRDEAKQIAERLRTAMEAQRKAVETVPVNDSLIRSTTQELAEVQADAAVARAHARSEILALLTADQRAQLTKLQADRQARFQQQRERLSERRQQRRQQQ
jgi:Spy/CpxP family protein refolding chaperone